MFPLFFLPLLAAAPRRGSAGVITTDEYWRRAAPQGDVVLLDVRRPDEYHGPSGHLAASVLIPVEQLERRAGELDAFRGKTIVVYCRTGHRSGIAASFLAERGHTALNMLGGIVEWRAKGFPVEHDPPGASS